MNTSSDERLRALRHDLILRAECCDEVVSLEPGVALSTIEDANGFDVLVICSRLPDQLADSLCLAFRKTNPAGRIIGIKALPWHRTCELDVAVDALQPDELVAAICSYVAARSRFRNKRHLAFTETGKWIGWSCESCCWHRPEPADRIADLTSIRAEFNAHSCEAFARQNWKARAEAPDNRSG